MAKKSRKTRRRSQAPRLTQAQMVQPQGQEQPRVNALAGQQASGTSPGLEEQYRYVLLDLRRIAVIAAVMLAVMVVLAVVAV